MRSPLRICLLLALGFSIAVVACGCTYSAGNSARGPEELRVVWPWSVCNEAPRPAAK